MEDGEGITYTDNHFYAYYWNINGEQTPYIDVYLNAEGNQDVVNLVNEEIKNDGKEPRVESYVNSVVRWARARQSSNNGNNGNNNSISSSRKIDGLNRYILRKGRYFNNPSLYVKTQRADRYNRDGINSTVSSSPAPAQRRQIYFTLANCYHIILPNKKSVLYLHFRNNHFGNDYFGTK